MDLILTDGAFARKYLQTVGDKGINISGYLRANDGVNIYTDKGGDGILTEKDGFVQVYSENVGFILAVKKFLSGKNCFYSNIEKSVAEILLDGVTPEWTTFCRILSYRGKSAPVVSLPQNVEVRNIDVKWLDLVNDNYPYKDEYSKDRIHSEITLRPSVAVYIDDVPVAWNLLHADYSMGAMFVQPEYRRQGYGYIAAAYLIGKVLADGMTPYVQIVSDNAASLALAGKLGFTPLFDAYFFEM